jgi:hypothetical protein
MMLAFPSNKILTMNSGTSARAISELGEIDLPLKEQIFKLSFDPDQREEQSPGCCAERSSFHVRL